MIGVFKIFLRHMERNEMKADLPFWCWPYSWIMLAFVSILQDQPERAVRVLAKMKKLKLNPDIRTFGFSLSSHLDYLYRVV